MDYLKQIEELRKKNELLKQKLAFSAVKDEKGENVYSNLLQGAGTEALFVFEGELCKASNDQALQMFGYTYGEIIELKFEDLFEKNSFDFKVNQKLAFPEKKRLVTCKHKSGEVFLAMLFIKECGGLAVLQLAVQKQQDISLHEKQLLESEKKLRIIFENAGDGILVGNKKGEIIDLNQSFCKMTGYDKDEILYKHISFLFNSSVLEQKPLRFDLLDIGKAIIIQRKIVGKQGNEISIEMNSRRLNEDYYLSIVRDLTEREEAAQNIEKTNKKLKEAQRLGKIGDWTLDFNTKIFTWSEELFKLFGYSLNERDTASIMEKHVHIDDARNFEERLALLFAETDNLPDFSFKVVHKNGEIRHFLSRGEFLRNHVGGKIGAFGTIQDVTDQKRAELNLIELNRSKDKLFSIIGHDLKNPFNTILGFSELLKEDLRESNFDDVREYSEMIHNGANKAYSLLTNLLDWTRSQFGALDFSPEWGDVKALTEEMLEFVKGFADQKSVQLNYIPDLSHSVFLDKNMYRTILRNLLTNAIKFSHPGGIVSVDFQEHNSNYWFCIHDNGLGMDSELLERIFKTNSHFSSEGTNKEQGTGLGLLICKEFVQKHGGDIWAESQLGKGTSLYFTFKKKEPKKDPN